jgi:pyridoxamine 5'-phosphate oxidase
MNPKVGLNFFWPELERQVRILGKAERLSSHESDRYFFSRPRESRIGAWASAQSEVIGSREQLEQRYKEIEKKYEGKDIDRPPHWGGFLVIPARIEFWQGRPGRLHDRIRYQREAHGWQLSRLQP